jgi:hypothetical protein
VIKGAEQQAIVMKGAEQQAIVMKWGRTTSNFGEVGQNNRQL